MSSVVAEKEFNSNLKRQVRLKAAHMAGGEQKILTQGGVVAQFHVIALKALFGSPSIVSSLHNDVNLLIAILTHISAEHPALAVATDQVPAVHRAPPHVSDPVCKHLRSGVWVTAKRVIRWDPVRLPAGVTSVYINAQCFSQQSTPGKEEIDLSDS